MELFVKMCSPYLICLVQAAHHPRLSPNPVPNCTQHCMCINVQILNHLLLVLCLIHTP